MGNVRVTATGKFPPERFVAALTDFSGQREKVFGNSAGSYLQVHEQGPDWAEVTEGSQAGGGIWQRYRYDWSTPGEVRLDVLDSNAFGKGSYWRYRVTPDGTGGSAIDLFIHRQPNSLKGRFVDVALLLLGKRIFGKDLRDTVRKIEAA
ncbi:MAG: hypothetical protein AUI14_10445 [Actinobacteria bacterium 13_2_20CM_2_71_6]|nr:MAG: hypothetical protein AUI14_10445 [Actinobacteria bacterium 13_2_20CM_2_71_6]